MGNIPGREVVTVGSTRLRIKKQVAKGGYAVVHLAETVQGEVVVVKRIMIAPGDPRRAALVDLARNEIRLMRGIRAHPHIVRLIDAEEKRDESGTHLFDMVLEFCRGGSVFEELQRSKVTGLPEVVVLARFRDACAAIAHLHSATPKPIAHRDIKPENLLLVEQVPSPASKDMRAAVVCRLCDFGSSSTDAGIARTTQAQRAVADRVKLTTTVHYRAPELAFVDASSPIGPGVDVWALGCLLFQLCVNRTPFEDPGTGRVHELGIRNARVRFPASWNYSANIKRMITWMLTADPRKRPSVLELMGKSEAKHRWVIKATSVRPGAPKAKYVRFLILDAWETNSPGATHRFIHRRPMAVNPVVAVKGLVLLLELWQDGPTAALTHASEAGPLLKELTRVWGSRSQEEHLRQAGPEAAALARFLPALAGLLLVKAGFFSPAAALARGRARHASPGPGPAAFLDGLYRLLPGQRLPRDSAQALQLAEELVGVLGPALRAAKSARATVQPAVVAAASQRASGAQPTPASGSNSLSSEASATPSVACVCGSLSSLVTEVWRLYCAAFACLRVAGAADAAPVSPGPAPRAPASPGVGASDGSRALALRRQLHAAHAAVRGLANLAAAAKEAGLDPCLQTFDDIPAVPVESPFRSEASAAAILRSSAEAAPGTAAVLQAELASQRAKGRLVVPSTTATPPSQRHKPSIALPDSGEVGQLWTTDVEVPYAEIELGPRIGQGGFAEVYRAKWRGRTVAVKKLLRRPGRAGDKAERDFRAEVALMIRLQHPNVVRFLGVCPEPLALVAEFCSRGNLFDLLHNSDVPLPWPLRVRMALDAARGMHFLHSQSPVIIHRDLKSLNLLVDSNWRVKVSDFGLSRFKHASSSSLYTAQCGTFHWMAPEVIAGHRYTERADVFSFGVNLWELLTRSTPYVGMEPMQVGLAVLHRGLRPAIPDDCPDLYKALMRACWRADPSRRPEFKQVIEVLEMIINGTKKPGNGNRRAGDERAGRS